MRLACLALNANFDHSNNQLLQIDMLQTTQAAAPGFSPTAENGSGSHFPGHPQASRNRQIQAHLLLIIIAAAVTVLVARGLYV